MEIIVRFQVHEKSFVDANSRFSMAALAKADGCTKTNPIIPELEEFKELFMKAYRGE